MSGWRDEAACLGEDPELFFPEKEGRPGAVRDKLTDDAKTVCARCPVFFDCRENADGSEKKDSMKYGVRAGETGNERTNRRRREAKREARAG